MYYKLTLTYTASIAIYTVAGIISNTRCTILTRWITNNCNKHINKIHTCLLKTRDTRHRVLYSDSTSISGVLQFENRYANAQNVSAVLIKFCLIVLGHKKSYQYQCSNIYHLWVIIKTGMTSDCTKSIFHTHLIL